MNANTFTALQKANDYAELLISNNACRISHETSIECFRRVGFYQLVEHYQERVRVANRIESRIKNRIKNLLNQVICEL